MPLVIMSALSAVTDFCLGVEQLRMLISLWSSSLITPPEATNTGPGFNQGSGGGARGCGFEERVGAYARTEGGHFLWPQLSVCLSVATKMAIGLFIHPLSRPIFKHAQHTYVAPTLPMGDTPNTRVLGGGRAERCLSFPLSSASSEPTPNTRVSLGDK